MPVVGNITAGIVVRSLLLLVVAIALGTSTMLAQPSDYPVYDPAADTYLNLATELLAEGIEERYGGDAWNDSIYVAFDYVVYTADDKEVLRYSHVWDRALDRANYAGKLIDGRPFAVTFSSFSKREGTMIVDSAQVASEHLESALRHAQSEFMHHARWLLLPLMIGDSGVARQRLNDTVVDGKNVTAVQVDFVEEDGKKTTFLMYVNTQYYNVERWRVKTPSGEKEYVWRGYNKFGPFLVSTKRWAADFEGYIRFENVVFGKGSPDAVSAASKKGSSGK